MRSGILRVGIPFALAAILLLVALPLPAPDMPPGGVEVWSEQETRPSALRDYGGFRYFRLDAVVHPTEGMDSLGGKAMCVGPDGSLYITRSQGVFAVPPDRKTYRYHWMPDAQRKRHIASIYVSRTSIWLGLTDGRVARTGLSMDSWKYYPIRANTPISLSPASGSLLAFETRAGGQVWYFNESADAFEPYFALPPELDVTPIAPLARMGNAWFMGSDLGVFKLGYLGMDNISWELCGTREGLAKTIIHDISALGQGFLLAGTRPQHPRLPSNIRPTSYGYFAWNYIQSRWERIAEPVPPKLEHFLGVNAANTNIPSNGLWYYESGRDIAHPLQDGDFFHILPVRPGLSLAASMRGLYAVGMYQGQYRALRMLELPDLWIDDLAADDRDVYILSGRGVFIIAKSNFTQDVFASGLAREALASASAAGSVSSASSADIIPGVTSRSSAASSSAAASASQQPGASASQEASSASGGASSAGVRDPAAYTEEASFIRQLEQFLKRLPKD